MKKLTKAVAVVMAISMMAFGIVGCGKEKTVIENGDAQIAQEEDAEVTEAEFQEIEDTEESVTEEVADDSSASDAEIPASSVLVRVGSLKGPTSMGLVNLMDKSDAGNAAGTYEFTMETQPDAIVAGVAKGDIDIALVPANLASALYNKTEGGVEVIAINTLGVLYCVTGDESISSVKDLAGKTVYSTGQGATPEYALNYLLSQNGVTDCTVEFKSEATEIAAVLADDPTGIAILPQPFVTVAEVQNEALKTAFSLSDEWDALGTDSKLLTGATIVRKAFLDENPEAVEVFMKEAAESVEASGSDVDATAELIAKYGIIEKAPIAKKALPQCNIVNITGDEMKSALSGYLEVLFNADPKAVGGKLPADDFYY